MPRYVYRIAEYDPGHRADQGRCTGPEDTVRGRGAVGAAYLRAVAAFAEDSGVDRPAVREPQVPSLARFGVGPPVDGFGLTGLFLSTRGRPRTKPAGGLPESLPGGSADGAEHEVGVRRVDRKTLLHPWAVRPAMDCETLVTPDHGQLLLVLAPADAGTRERLDPLRVPGIEEFPMRTTRSSER